MVEANGLGSSLEYPLDPLPPPCSCRRRRCRLGNKAPNPSEKGARGYDLYELSSAINEYEIDLQGGELNEGEGGGEEGLTSSIDGRRKDLRERAGDRISFLAGRGAVGWGHWGWHFLWRRCGMLRAFGALWARGRGFVSERGRVVGMSWFEFA